MKNKKQDKKYQDETERIRKTLIGGSEHMASGTSKGGEDLVRHLREPYKNIVLYGEKHPVGTQE